MTQDDVIRLATQARLPHDYDTEKPMWLDRLTQFAKLVAEHERSACAVHAVEIARRAVEEERSACVELIPPQYHELRDRIRARDKDRA